MIKNIIFDIGKVLVTVEWSDYVRTIIHDEELAEYLTWAVWKSSWWPEMDRGVLPEEEVLSHILDAAGEHWDQAQKLLDRFTDCLGRCDYAIPWVKEMKDLGYRVYFLSNYSDFLIRGNPGVLDFLPLMDGGVFSHEAKLIKPDPAIYQKLCSDYALVPGECLFIDDTPVNIALAKQCGLHGFVFEDYEKSYPEIMEYLKTQRDL